MATALEGITHSSAFKTRRFLNWFPMGLTYAMLYMGRYNLTVAKTSLNKTQLMTKEDFGLIFFWGTIVYAVSFIFNGPLIDRIGGRKGILAAAFGASAANFGLAFYLHNVLNSSSPPASVATVFSVLFALNMYFQSFGAVSIIKVNSNWFHLRERGSFSGIFGTMISSGIFFAFTVNGWLLGLAEKQWGERMQWVVFAAPAAILAFFGIVEFFLLRDRPSDAGHTDFDDGTVNVDTDTKPIPALEIYKRLFKNPIIVTVALIELCTGVVRNGVFQWFPIYVDEVWVLPKSHYLQFGSWGSWWLIVGMFAVAVVSFGLGRAASGSRKGSLFVFGALAFLAPFLQGGWGGILFVAGVIGGNVAGWVSDLFFQSRRGPTAGGLYAFMVLCVAGMIATLATPGTTVMSIPPPAKDKVALSPDEAVQPGDKILAIAGKDVKTWADVRLATACWPAACKGSGWNADPQKCTCDSSLPQSDPPAKSTIPARVERNGGVLELELKDPNAVMRPGDKRLLPASPELPMSPYMLGGLVFLITLCVLGSHGMLSGTATMDFGGRKAAGTAAGMIDGFVYLGTAIQSLSLGYITTRDWAWWPPFMLPFAIIGFLLCLKIWNARAGKPAH